MADGDSEAWGIDSIFYTRFDVDDEDAKLRSSIMPPQTSQIVRTMTALSAASPKAFVQVHQPQPKSGVRRKKLISASP